MAVCPAVKAQQLAINWAGKYHYDEEPVKANAGYAMVMEWDLTIIKNGHRYTGTIEINGQQTYIKALTDIVEDKDGIRIVFNRLLDGIGNNKKGDVLFLLRRKDNKLVTQWASLTPILAEKYPKECTCFIKK
jgi:hypothetical protein